jgi:hypothetical protein
MSTLNKLVDSIDYALDNFNGKIPDIQKRMFKEITILVKELDTKSDRIVQSVENVRKLAKIQKKLSQLFESKEYVKSVTDFAKTFSTIQSLNNEYFNEINSKYKTSEFLSELRKQSVTDAVESLTGGGINSQITDGIKDKIFDAIKSGSSYNNLLESIRVEINGDKTSLGKLERYARQITTDSLNQYNAAYQENATADLGLEWFMYNGALMDTSRDFCIACVKKKYIHKSEFSDLIKGNFKEFKDIDGKISQKTKLPYGMIDGTNSTNLIVRRGGYGCNHKMIPVAKEVVPKELRAKYE